jgi:integrase
MEMHMGAKNVTGVRKVTRGKKPRWIIDFRFTNKDGRRERFRRDASVQNHGAALAEATRLMKRAAETGAVENAVNSDGLGECLTYRAFVQGPFEQQFMPGYRPATRVRYVALHRQSVMAFFENKRLNEIGASEFRAFAAQIQGKGLQTKGPVTLVRTVLRAAHESGHLEELPNVPRGLVKTGRKLPDAPSLEEFRLMLTAPGWLGVAIALAGLAGLRMGEVRALEVRDVDVEGNRLLVRRALSEDESLTPKSGHERLVPMVPDLTERLAAAMKDKLPRARVVVAEDGCTPPRQLVLHRFKRFLKANGLKERSFHSLRHFFITELVRREIGLETVRTLAGHSKLDMTQRYAHATSADLRAAMDKFGT